MEISEVNKPVLNFNNLSGFWKAIVSSQSELFHDQTRAVDHRAGREEQTIAETLTSARRAVA